MVSRVIFENLPVAEKLDLIDKKILFYLVKNCRISDSLLAKELKISREVVSFRIKRLVDKGIIVSFFPALDMTSFGFELFSVYLKFRNLSPENDALVRNFLVKSPATIWVVRCTGKWDYYAVFLAKDLMQFHELIYSLENSLADLLKEFDFQMLLYEYLYSHLCKGFFDGIELKEIFPHKSDASFEKLLKETSIEISKKRTVHKIDLLDLKILEKLSENARLSFQELSSSLDIPAETVRYRISQLIKKKIIGNFPAVPSFSRLGFNWQKVMVQTKGIDEKTDAKLRVFFRNHPFVFWALRSFGKYDLVFDVNSRNSEEFSRILSDFFEKFNDIIIDYESIEMLQDIKYTNFVKIYYSILE